MRIKGLSTEDVVQIVNPFEGNVCDIQIKLTKLTTIIKHPAAVKSQLPYGCSGQAHPSLN